MEIKKLLKQTFRDITKSGFSLMKNVPKSSAKGVLIPLELTVATSATDAAIQNKFLNKVIRY